MEVIRMLKITVPADEMWDEAKQEFVYGKSQTLMLEHSLVSISKWESKWCKPYLTDTEKSTEEIIDYIRCMTIGSNVDYKLYYRLSDKSIKEISNYINYPMTATTFREVENSNHIKGEQITAELIYYYMVALHIPFECEKWHLNKLITLIRVCSIKSQPPKKMSKSELARRNRELNAQRRSKLNSKG
jgi:hypothetical protein